jgi:hypothetical protein
LKCNFLAFRAWDHGREGIDGKGKGQGGAGCPVR